VASEFPRIVVVGRTRPSGVREADAFIRADLAVPTDIEAACAALSHPVRGVVLGAGVDSRAGLAAVTGPEFQQCMRVNCWSGLRLLSALSQPRTVQRRTLPVVVISSDVLGGSLPDTVAYAASKAALEEGLRHAVADFPSPGLAVLFIRLPDLGIPMLRTDGTRPEPTPPPRSAVLDVAVERAVVFLLTPPPPGTVEMFSHA
jgi:NAD(P)-dependent dehydrogenase (short-subunit alcohol dehydrogenase family)